MSGEMIEGIGFEEALEKLERYAYGDSGCYDVSLMEEEYGSGCGDGYEGEEIDPDAVFRCAWCGKLVLEKDAERCLDDRVCRGRCWDHYCNAPIEVVGVGWWDVEGDITPS